MQYEFESILRKAKQVRHTAPSILVSVQKNFFKFNMARIIYTLVQKNHVKRSRTPVFVRDDFKDIGGYDQVGRIWRGLVKNGLLISLGYGTYARSKKSSVSGIVVPESPLPELAKELLKKLGVKVVPSSAEKVFDTSYGHRDSSLTNSGTIAAPAN